MEGSSLIIMCGALPLTLEVFVGCCPVGFVACWLVRQLAAVLLLVLVPLRVLGWTAGGP